MRAEEPLNFDHGRAENKIEKKSFQNKNMENLSDFASLIITKVFLNNNFNSIELIK